ncbi:MAG: DUF1343 domain-containing protein [Cytophagales bacterium]|nr:DUF1343 domain-containing protein [Bernardetiaceae bacterium]MDW8203756.1 DUF1343 domain-containing protein [Cytophagales bacterium]
MFLFACGVAQPAAHQVVQFIRQENIVVGAARFDQYLSALQGKRVALTVNHTATVGTTHLLDTLLAQGIQVVKIFVPEHGFRGTADAGEKVANEYDKKTGLPIISLYGKRNKPLPEDLADVDVVVFDIQDVGARFYTYINTMQLLMEACAEQNKKLIVLDRPNPNGWYVDGPVLDMRYKSFVGMQPIPIVHGLTVGELAHMINGEGWLAGGITCPLQVITCLYYDHTKRYSLPIRPSPNLPNDRAIALYPSLCLLEGTIVSVGRGTEAPFQVIGFPENPDKQFCFSPRSTEGAKNPPHKDKICCGIDYRQTDVSHFGFSLQPLMEMYRLAPQKDQFFIPFFEKLAGTDQLRQQIIAGMSEAAIKATWAEDLAAYKAMRKKYLLYADFE